MSGDVTTSYTSCPIVYVWFKILSMYFLAIFVNLLDVHRSLISNLVNEKGVSVRPGSFLIKSSFKLSLSDKYFLYFFKLPPVTIID